MEKEKDHPKEELIIRAGQVELISWPESQGCIGCPYAGLILSSGKSVGIVGDPTYTCLCNDRSKVPCDNPEA